MANCVACHQANGEGLPGLYPALADSEWLRGPESRIVRILLNGLSGPMTVRGARFDSVMPAFRDLLTDEEIAAVLTFARASWNNGASAVPAQTVGSVRKQTFNRAGNWTAAELASIP